MRIARLAKRTMLLNSNGCASCCGMNTMVPLFQKYKIANYIKGLLLPAGMPIVGLQFTKILVEKYGPIKGKIQVQNNVALKDVEKSDLTVGSSKQGAVKFHFEYKAKYEPKLADITIAGFLTSFETPDKIKEILDGWKKDKKLPNETMTSVLNTILSRCNVEALIFAREVNLPPPIPMPKVSVK